MLTTNGSNATGPLTTDMNEDRQYLISDENYQLLRQFQQMVFKEIELLPSIRKLINELITPENLEKIKPKYFSLLNR